MGQVWRPAPPRSLADWHRFQEECWRRERPDWCEIPKITIPETWRSADGIEWIPFAHHPLTGNTWCWRCLAEAQGAPVGPLPHHRKDGTICWGQAERDPGTEDRKQDGRAPGDESTSDWTEAGRRYVAEGIDTGTFFYDPPPPPASAPRRQVVEGQVWLTKLDAENNPVGPPVHVGQGGFAGTPGWHGFPSWTDDAPSEPVDEDISERSSQPTQTPFSPDRIEPPQGDPA